MRTTDIKALKVMLRYLDFILVSGGAVCSSVENREILEISKK